MGDLYLNFNERPFMHIFLLITLVLTSLVSCTTTTLDKKINLPELSESEKVTVFADKAPPFTTELICSSSTEINGVTPSTDLKDYSQKAEKVARKCGAPIAIVKSVTQIGSSTYIRIEGHRQISEVDKLRHEDELVKNLATALFLGNTEQVKKILEFVGVNKKFSLRSDWDNSVLFMIMNMAAEKGEECPANAMDFLFTEYSVYIERFVDYRTKEKYGYSVHEKKVNVDTKGILSCSSVAVVESFKAIHTQADVILGISAIMTGLANSGLKIPTLTRNFLAIYPTIRNLIESECLKDSLSGLCSVKDNLAKNYKYLQPAPKQPAKQPKSIKSPQRREPVYL